MFLCIETWPNQIEHFKPMGTWLKVWLTGSQPHTCSSFWHLNLLLRHAMFCFLGAGSPRVEWKLLPHSLVEWSHLKVLLVKLNTSAHWSIIRTHLFCCMLSLMCRFRGFLAESFCFFIPEVVNGTLHNRLLLFQGVILELHMLELEMLIDFSNSFRCYVEYSVKITNPLRD